MRLDDGRATECLGAAGYVSTGCPPGHGQVATESGCTGGSNGYVPDRMAYASTCSGRVIESAIVI